MTADTAPVRPQQVTAQEVQDLPRSLRDKIPETEQPAVAQAYAYAFAAHQGQMRASGEPYIQHSVAVAEILADMRLDTRTVIAGLLHDVVEDTGVSLDDLRREFGDEVAALVDGVTKLSHIDLITREDDTKAQADARAESLRKMFLAMVDDVRVVLIKLADRLHNMRTLGAMPEEKRRRIAQETLDIFAPLANRLGIWQMKWELEDLSLRHLDPEVYRQLARELEERRRDRETEIQQIVAMLRQRLREQGIEAEVTGRAKHIYSIYKKMQRKDLDFDHVYDVRGVRIIVDTVQDCYAALGVVHSLWRPIHGTFDDFIATPKDNMYQSLHSAVVGPGGKPLEVQIRTWSMHQTAEYGIAAHWRYKEPGTRRDIVFENKIAWLRQLMEWRQDVTDARDFLDSLKTDVFRDRVYVFTPKGDIIDLPAGATAIDFAYHVHTDVGHRCRGAKINGQLVGLDYTLKNGDQVEILTAKRGGPSRDWLNADLGYVRTARARQKIRTWFRRQDRAQNISLGRDMLERELKRLGYQGSLDQVAAALGYDSVDDLHAAIGYGDLNTQQVATRLLEAEEKPAVEEPPPDVRMPAAVSEIHVRGVGNILTTLAKCCRPVPGDDITGYVTRGRGVTVHRRDCPNILNSNEQERLIEVEWGGGDDGHRYPVSVHIRAWDRGGLLRDIAAVVADEDINMSAANVVTQKKENMATITATLEIRNMAQLSRTLARLEHLPNVLEARRLVG
ncbi:MAG: GTP diphosphokinase [Anaerolineae bacterium]